MGKTNRSMKSEYEQRREAISAKHERRRLAKERKQKTRERKRRMKNAMEAGDAGMFYSCARKNRFCCEDEARNEIGYLRRVAVVDGRELELWTYRCQYCGGWHLTHLRPACYIDASREVSEVLASGRTSMI